MKGFFKKAAALLMAGLMAGSKAAVPAYAEEAEDAAPEKVELSVGSLQMAHLRSQQWRAEALTLLISDMELISFASRDRLRSLHQALYTAQTV